MRCQFFETPKVRRQIRHSYTRNHVRLSQFEPLAGAVRCPGKMKVRLTVTHEGGYGSCSYDLKVQYYCTTCKKVLHGEELPGSCPQVEDILQAKLDKMNDFDFDKLADAAEERRKKRIREQIKAVERFQGVSKKRRR